jgi:hypothetical protein
MYAEMGNNGPTEMQLKFQDSGNHFVSISTPTVGAISQGCTTANHGVTTKKCWGLNEQREVFALLLAQN